MKWFKHDTDATDDIKIKRLEEEFGNDGYATFFKTLEIIGKNGVKGRLLYTKFPKKWLSQSCRVSEEKLTKIYELMGELNLCCRKSLKRDELYIPKFKKRADDYTKRLRRQSEGATDNVLLDKNRIDKNRTEEDKNKNKELLEHFTNLYKEETGIGYPVVYGRDKKILYDLMAVNSVEEVKSHITEFFEGARDTACWWYDKALDVPMFRSMVTRITAKARGKL